MWEAILDEFDKLPDVDFAYPTMRRFDNRYEGKAELSSEAPKEEPAKPAKPAKPSSGRVA
jgi:hypothetical protein